MEWHCWNKIYLCLTKILIHCLSLSCVKIKAELIARAATINCEDKPEGKKLPEGLLIMSILDPLYQSGANGESS